MQLSHDEFVRVSQLSPTRTTVGGIALGNLATAPARRTEGYNLASFNASEEARLIAENLETQLDERDEIVASLRSRIETGAYQVTGEQIADMMVRRFLADRVR